MSNETVGVEIERKYVIAMPDTATLSAMENYTVSHIVQTYLAGAEGETRRVRRRDFGDRVMYIETRKIRIDSMSSTEIERELSEEEYLSLAAEPLEGTRPLLKTRHTFDLDGQTFEIDVYPYWQRTAIMETELKSREVSVKMPSFINIIKEVTGDRSYSNASMSRAFPQELI